MKHIPILYSTPMVLAKIARRKNQTRRIIKLQDGTNPDDESISRHLDGSFDKAMDFTKHYPKWTECKCPYGQPGDILWTRETFIDGDESPCSPHHEEPELYSRYAFKADCPLDQVDIINWKPSIFMPKEACRFFDEITEIRVERVADISEADSIAEGMYCEVPGVYKWGNENGMYDAYSSAKTAYRSLWTKINGNPSPIQKKENGKMVTVSYEVYPFDEEAAAPFSGLTTWRGKPLTVVVNPLVWVICFKPTERPENW